jgi:hypothetical protein
MCSSIDDLGGELRSRVDDLGVDVSPASAMSLSDLDV